jgi:hypothetical protein
MDIAYESIGDYEVAIAFSEQVTRLVCHDGVAGLVLPNTVLLNESARQIRKRLTFSSWILWIADLTNHPISERVSSLLCNYFQEIHLREAYNSVFTYTWLPSLPVKPNTAEKIRLAHTLGKS